MRNAAALVVGLCLAAWTPAAKPDAPTPSVASAASQVVPLGPNQKLLLTGADFQEGATANLTDPSGKSTPLPAAAIKRLSATQLEVTASFGAVGDWKITVQNPGGAPSAAATLKVAASPAVPPDSPAVAAYQNAAGVITKLVVALLIAVAVGLVIATFQGWSPGDVVSEESSQQPAVINNKKDVVMVASASRLIALLGLLGILTTVLGVGYAVIWQLFLYGTVTDLSQVRNFLFGSACLFAPYLANQLREVFSPSNPTAPEGGGAEQAAGGAAITGIVPAAPAVAAAAQQVNLTGSGFERGLSVALTDPHGTRHVLTGGSITSVSKTLVQTNAVLDQPGEWQAFVTNPGGAPSDALRFTVFGPPSILAVDPAAPIHNAAAQNLALVGDGFMNGLTVQLAGAAAPANVTVTSVGSTRVVVSAILANAGACQAVVTNPGGHASAPFNFNVT